MKETATEKKYSVLFVCTANLCRSPMAEAIFKWLVSEGDADSNNWEIASAGTWAESGLMVPRLVEEVMAGYGLDLTRHRARMLDGQMMRDYELILTMEAGHKEALQLEFREHAEKVHMLSEMSGEEYSIPDPMGQSLKVHEQVAESIKKWLEQGLPRIYELALKD